MDEVKMLTQNRDKFQCCIFLSHLRFPSVRPMLTAEVFKWISKKSSVYGKPQKAYMKICTGCFFSLALPLKVPSTKKVHLG